MGREDLEGRSSKTAVEIMGWKSRLRKRTRTAESSEPSPNKSKAVPTGRKTIYSDIVCEECRRGDDEDKLLLCDECDRGFHMYCLRPVVVRVPAGKWFCDPCSKKDRVKEFPLVQTKIIDFFRIQRSSPVHDIKCNESRKRKKRTPSLVLTKKRRRLLTFTPRRMQQMASLATALTSAGVQFSDELTYMHGMAPRSANRAVMEKGGMQVISKEDKSALELCKLMLSRGEWPPLFVRPP